ncbi:MAG: tRNA (guanosine(37)-N1)-methyltransferase TrmD [Proteobacteria bacterium]|nr:MAG: tRNA (guanosine(37)-N1)-methyltransferase TrmD [Pseudomonadota bacterium]
MTPYLNSSIVGRAVKSGRFHFHALQLRDFAADKHRTVDSAPYGGGEGMVLRADILHSAWKRATEILAENSDLKPRTVLLSPQGRLLTQESSLVLLEGMRPLILICGHYEGVDERFIETCVDEEWSIGDYVLTGGELPALVILDCLLRQIPGVLGNFDSFTSDSFQDDGLLKYPQYTRPETFEGRAVPDILKSGNHGKIEKWRRAESEARTARKRPELVKVAPFPKASKSPK